MMSRVPVKTLHLYYYRVKFILWESVCQIKWVIAFEPFWSLFL